ncbi:MAG: SDR family oxidoreductase [Rhodospirillaceae bacterium]|nr:SDR family oxidoreductase [Rhodospirillaceae bacterium]
MQVSVIARLAAVLMVLFAAAWGVASRAAEGGVLVFGGNRDTGLEIVRHLKSKGDAVTVFVRATSDVTELKKLGVATVTGDALKADDVKAAIAAGKYRAVVSSLGGKRGEPRPDFEGVKNVVDGAKAAGVKRMVLVTAIGVGDSAGAVSPDVHKILGPIFAQKVKGEDYLKASGLTYTIIRPGGLGSGVPTGTAKLTEDKTVGSEIYREDLGQVTADTIDDPKTYNKTFSAIDPTMMEAGPLTPRPGLVAPQK